MAVGGIYRIDSEEFDAPVTSWEAQIIGPKLNGLPSLNSYYLHTWTWPGGGLEGCDFERLLDLFYTQDATGQLSTLETDDYRADGSIEKYGTKRYTNFIIQSVWPVARGLPHYNNPRIVFEVHVGSEQD